MVWVFGLLVLIVVGFGLYVRLAPSDATRWHVSPVTDASADCTVRQGRGDARAACGLALPPAEALARLDAVAMATPRTVRLAGSADEGRITWITRSRLWGFPDYTTAEVRSDGAGARLDIFARLRFGGEDMGVNAARLTTWLDQMAR